MRRSIKVMASLLMIAIMMCSMVGCASDVESRKAANLMEGVTAKAVDVSKKTAEYSAEVTDFAVRLYNACNATANAGENTLVSPLSVLLALSMTANGAQDETLAQMEEVLGMPAGTLNEFAHAFLNSLPDDPGFFGELESANSIWFTADPKFHVNRDFLQLNADYYNADIYAALFDDSTVKDINNWVNNKTKGMIPSVLDSIPDDAIMYLINALAFDAEWMNIYNERQIHDDSFTTASGEQKQVPFMLGKEYDYLEDDKATGFVKYYKGKRYAFAAILPNEGITPAEYLNSLSGEHLSEMLIDRENCEVLTSLPKFKTEYSLEMSGILKSMGMPLAFDDTKADFYKIGTLDYDDYRIYISRVLHKTYIEVDEKGTKAGAATVVEMMATTSALIEKPQPKEVYLTRPFIYMLIDCESNIPFFIGVMNNPDA